MDRRILLGKVIKRLAYEHKKLEKFSPVFKKTFEELPIVWESINTKGIFRPEHTIKEQWRDAELKGKLRGQDLIIIQISRRSTYFKYSVFFDGKRYEFENLEELKKRILSLNKEDRKKETLNDFYKNIKAL